MNGYTPVRSIKTRLYPYKLFRDGTGFLSVSLPVPVENYFYGTTLYRAKMLIEHIN